jgi:putative DNA primase/helicase
MVKVKYLKKVGIIEEGEIVDITSEEAKIYVDEEHICEYLESPKTKKEYQTQVGIQETTEKLIASEKVEEKKRTKDRSKNPQLTEIKDTINLRTAVLELLAQKHPDRSKATELLTREAKRRFIIHSIRDDLKQEMWIYKDGIQIPNGKSFIDEFCRFILQEAYTESLSKLVCAKVREDTLINAEEFFKYDNLDEIPILNGILNTTTWELSSFTPEKLFFNKIPVNYNPQATCPKLEGYYKDVLADEEDIKVMYEILGDGLSKRYDFQKSIIQYGDGSNSKGISQSIIKKFFGAENCSSVALNQMTLDSNSVAELFGKFMNTAGDLDRQALRETGVFKLLTSGTDDISAKRKYMRDLKFKNFAKMIFACNEFPKVYDTSFGFWRRWIILNYPFKFISKEDYDKLEDKGSCKIKNPNIFEEITTEEEMSGLLNKALDGLARLRKNKGYSSTKGTEEIKNFWIRKSSPFTAFCIDCLDANYNGVITKKKLRNTFSKYCKAHSIGGVGDKELKATLQDFFGASEDRKMSNGEMEYIWEGIQFKQDYEEFLKKDSLTTKKLGFFQKSIEQPTPNDFQENHSNPSSYNKQDIELEEQFE